MIKALKLAAAASALALSVSAHADVAVVGFTGGTEFSNLGTSTGTATIGWRFSTLQNLDVTSLGWRVTNGAALNTGRQIGLWSSTGTLLASLTLTPGAATLGDYRFASLSSPLALTAGQSYLIGGLDTIADNDNYVSNVSGLVTNPAIQFTGTAFFADGFGAPNVFNPNASGRFGPNFEFSIAGVPEPGTWAMMILGLGAIGGAMRRRKPNITTRVRFA